MVKIYNTYIIYTEILCTLNTNSDENEKKNCKIASSSYVT